MKLLEQAAAGLPAKATKNAKFIGQCTVQSLECFYTGQITLQLSWWNQNNIFFGWSHIASSGFAWMQPMHH